MSNKRESRELADCPFINDDRACCSNRFSLGRLDQAFTICFGSYHGCSMYRELREANVPKPVVLTCEMNRAVGSGAVPLVQPLARSSM